MRRAILCGSAIAAVAVGSTALAAGAPRNARIAGRVLVCNTPEHCLTRQFVVSAFNSAGHAVARTKTKSPDNAYRLHLASGQYRLVAKSSGLVCQASAVAVAGQTTRRNITCLVP